MCLEHNHTSPKPVGDIISLFADCNGAPVALLFCALFVMDRPGPYLVEDPSSAQHAPVFLFSLSEESDFNRFPTVDLPRLPFTAVQRRFWPETGRAEFSAFFVAQITRKETDVVFRTGQFWTIKPMTVKTKTVTYTHHICNKTNGVTVRWGQQPHHSVCCVDVRSKPSDHSPKLATLHPEPEP